MFKKFIAFSKKKIFWVVLLLLATTPTYSTLIRPGFFPMQDDLQAFRIYEMDKCFQDFQIPCRWVPDAGYKYGYPQFNYYPPSVYYVGELLHIVGFQFVDVVKILFAAGYVLSALTMFILVSEILGNFSGFVSAILYTYIPYKAVEVYVRGAMSEFWSLIFYPLIFWAVYKLIKTGKKKFIAITGISLGLLLTTHVLMSMIFSFAAVVWTLYWLIKENKLKEIGKVILGVVLGVSLAAFFVLPVVFEKQYAHTETLTMGYFGYLQHFVNVYKLFISTEWGYGSSGFINEKLNLSTGLVQWIFALISLAVAVTLTLLKKKKDNLSLIITLSVLELFTLFMIHVKSSFIWKELSFLAILQFPWRILTVSIFLLSIICGLGVNLFSKYKYYVGVLIITLSVAINIGYFVPKGWLNISDADKFSGMSWQKQMTISIFDYLPIYAKLPPISQAPDIPEVLSGKVNFTSYKKGSDFQIGTLDVEENATVRLPLFDFPGMKVKVNGNIIPHTHDNCTNEEFCLGLITINLPPGHYDIETRLTNTPVRTIGNCLSIIGTGVILVLLFKKDKKKNEKNTK